LPTLGRPTIAMVKDMQVLKSDRVGEAAR